VVHPDTHDRQQQTSESNGEEGMHLCRNGRGDNASEQLAKVLEEEDGSR
jgi:hypothetical protein